MITVEVVVAVVVVMELHVGGGSGGNYLLCWSDIYVVQIHRCREVAVFYKCRYVFKWP